MVSETERLKHLIVELTDELERFKDSRDPELYVWRNKMFNAIERIQGGSGLLAIRFRSLTWGGGLLKDIDVARGMYVMSNPFESARVECRGILKTLDFLVQQQEDLPEEWGGSVDPELWDHVSTLVESKDWGKIPNVVATFLEGRLRLWAGLSVGVKMSTQVFQKTIGPDGYFPLGNSEDRSEGQGWSQLGTGFALAIRNTAAHGRPKGPYSKQYAFGVIGLASLIMTELKSKYGDPPAKQQEP